MEGKISKFLGHKRAVKKVKKAKTGKKAQNEKKRISRDCSPVRKNFT